MEWVFQQDNAPCHKSRITMNHLVDSDITVIDWAPNSPDINPIETAWELFKKKIRQRNVTKEEMWNNICQVGQNSQTMQKFRANIPASIVRRVQSLLCARGGHMKY
jgi:transposase